MLLVMTIHWRASLFPIATLISAPIAYVKLVSVKNLLFWFRIYLVVITLRPELPPSWLSFKAISWLSASSGQNIFGNAWLSVGHSDRRLRSHGCFLTPVIHDMQQRWQWLACPLLSISTQLFVLYSAAMTILHVSVLYGFQHITGKLQVIVKVSWGCQHHCGSLHLHC